MAGNTGVWSSRCHITGRQSKGVRCETASTRLAPVFAQDASGNYNDGMDPVFARGARGGGAMKMRITLTNGRVADMEANPFGQIRPADLELLDGEEDEFALLDVAPADVRYGYAHPGPGCEVEQLPEVEQ